MNRFSIVLAIVLLGNISHGASLDSLARHALGYARAHLKRSVLELQDSSAIPRSTLPDGRWQTAKPSDWTSGFFAGCLWYMYDWSKDPFFQQAALRWTHLLESQKLNRGTHDVGFMMMCSYGNLYKQKPDTQTRQILLTAARSLASRFNTTVGCIKSWDGRKQWPYPVIIDNMMNLELLFWAAKQGGPKELYDIALRHAIMTAKNHFRPDGSTYHVVDYDTTTGAVRVKETHQGYANESVWSRGQAWAIYGFTMAYRETKHAELLATARKAADYFIANLPPDHVPYWDFRAPGIPQVARDASAGAIAASGLLELSKLVTDKEEKARYAKAGASILQSLCGSPYLSEGTPSRGILNKSTGNHPKNGEVEVSLIYGDYYFLEALERYLKWSTP